MNNNNTEFDTNTLKIHFKIKYIVDLNDHAAKPLSIKNVDLSVDWERVWS